MGRAKHVQEPRTHRQTEREGALCSHVSTQVVLDVLQWSACSARMHVVLALTHTELCSDFLACIPDTLRLLFASAGRVPVQQSCWRAVQLLHQPGEAVRAVRPWRQQGG